MEVAVSDFVSHTGSEPGLARDILQSANWDIHAAYNLYNDLKSGSHGNSLSSTSHIHKDLQQRSLAADVGDGFEEDFRFPLPSLNDSTSLNLVVGEEEEEVQVERGRESSQFSEAPPSPSHSPTPGDQRCIDCIKADNVVIERAQSSQDWIISNCPHIEGFHPANLITPPSSYNGSYCEDFARHRKQQQQQLKPSKQPSRIFDNNLSSRSTDSGTPNAHLNSLRHSRREEGTKKPDIPAPNILTSSTSSIDERAPTSLPAEVFSGQRLLLSTTAVTSAPVDIIASENPFDPSAAGGPKADFSSGDPKPDSQTESKFGSAPCESGFLAMSTGSPSSSTSTAGPLKDTAIDSPVSDGDTEKAAPVVEQLNGTITRKFARGISAIADNRPLVFQARFQVMRDIQEDEASNSQYFVETPHYSFMLPDLRSYPVDFQQFLRKDLVETSSLVSLENAGRLNWWVEKGAGQTLLPLATSGDGNCLLHAASLGMWGFHDRLLTLRKALHHTLTASPCKGALWRRWRWHQTLQNKQVSLVYSDAIWEEEWNGLVKLSSTTPRSKPESSGSSANKGTSPKLMGGGGGGSAAVSNGASTSGALGGGSDEAHGTAPLSPSHVEVTATTTTTTTAAAAAAAALPKAESAVDSGATKGVPTDAGNETKANVDPPPSSSKESDSTFYESLEEFHVFVLAHVLRRPIIVVADTMLKDSNGDPFQPIHFGGVYLPLECPPSSCKRSPLVLCYDAAHFSAVVAMEGHAPNDPDDEKRKLLPVVVPVLAPDFNLLPLHFAVDPGEDFDWEKETKNPKIAKKLVLSTKDKLDMLLKYLDIVRIPLPKASKNGTLNKRTNVTNGTIKQGEPEKFVSNSIWGNDERSAYGAVDYDSSLRNDEEMYNSREVLDEPFKSQAETSLPSPMTATNAASGASSPSSSSRVQNHDAVDGHPSTLPPSHPSSSRHPAFSSSSSSSHQHHRHPRPNNPLMTGLGSIGRSVTKKLRRNLGFINGNGKKTVAITTTHGGDGRPMDETYTWTDVASAEGDGTTTTTTTTTTSSRKSSREEGEVVANHTRQMKERKLSAVFGCAAQVPDDDVSTEDVNGREDVDEDEVDGPAPRRPVVLEEDLARVELTSTSAAAATTTSPRRHRRLLSSDVNYGRQFFGAVKNGSGAKTLPKASTPSSASKDEQRNRKYGVALRNPFSTLERQKIKGEGSKSNASSGSSSSLPTLTAAMIGDVNFLIAAKFCTNKRHEYQNEMLQNYLQNVRERFDEDNRSKAGARKSSREETGATTEAVSSQRQNHCDEQRQQRQQQQHSSTLSAIDGQNPCSRLDSNLTTSTSTKPPAAVSSSSSSSNRHPCISPGCNLYGSSVSSYLCNTCFAKHREEAVTVEKDIQLRGSSSRLNSPVKRQPASVATASSPTVAAASAPKRAGSSNNLLAVKSTNGAATFSSLPRRK